MNYPPGVMVHKCPPDSDTKDNAYDSRAGKDRLVGNSGGDEMSEQNWQGERRPDDDRKPVGGRRYLIFWSGVVIAAMFGLMILPAFLDDGGDGSGASGGPGAGRGWRPVRYEAGTQAGDTTGTAGGYRFGPQGSPTPQVLGRLNRRETDMVRAVEAVRPAVVGVVNLQRAGDGMRRQAEMVEAGTGSGVVYEVKGNVAHVVTNNHVIEGASQVEVVCGIGDRAAAKVLGADSLTDLAVLAVDARFVKGVARFGNSDQLVPGQQAIAIGNPLGLDFSQTVTAGVISATNRAIPLDFDGDGEAEWELETIQTDAAINPGNSGGALVNLRGEVVGINSLKISDAGIEGMGFAIPVNDALPIIRQLAEEGQIQRPYLGITPKSLQAIPNQERVNQLRLPQEVISGVVVLRVDPPARQAGLKPMDVIVQMDDQSIHSAADLRRYLYTRKRPGETVRISYLRGGELRETVIRLTPMAKPG